MDKERQMISGVIHSIIYNEDGEITSNVEDHNYITPAALHMFNAYGPGMIFKNQHGSPFGKVVTLGPKGFKLYYPGNYTAENRFNVSNEATIMYMLYFSDPSVYTSSVKYLPVLNSSGNLDDSHVIGFGTINTNVSDKREGYANNTSDAKIITDDTIEEAWYFAPGQATGSWNCLAFMPGIEDNPYVGIINYKCITKSNPFISNSTITGTFIGPNITDGTHVITAPDEILMNYTSNGLSRWKFNLTTGKTTQVPTSDPAYTFPMLGTGAYPRQELVVGNYYYVLAQRSVYVYNIATQALVTTLVGAYNDDGNQSMWYDGTNIIVSSAWNCDDSDSNYQYATQVTISTSTNTITSTVYNKNYTGWGTIPSSWNKTRMWATKVDNLYYVSCIGKGTIICTDIANIGGTVVGVCDLLTNTCIMKATLDPTGTPKAETEFIKVGTGLTDKYGLYNGQTYTQIDYSTSGVWLSRSDYSNYFTLYKYTTSQDKSDAAYAEIGYGFQILDS